MILNIKEFDKKYKATNNYGPTLVLGAKIPYI